VLARVERQVRLVAELLPADHADMAVGQAVHVPDGEVRLGVGGPLVARAAQPATDLAAPRHDVSRLAQRAQLVGERLRRRSGRLLQPEAQILSHTLTSLTKRKYL